MAVEILTDLGNGRELKAMPGTPLFFTYPPLEGFPLLNSECVRLSDDRDDVDTVMQATHKLHVYWAQTAQTNTHAESSYHTQLNPRVVTRDQLEE